MKEGMHEGAVEFSRERHESAARETVEKLRGDGYFREGEKAEFVRPGAGDKWVLRCDADQLDVPQDPGSEWKKKFPSADPLHEAFEAAGFRVDVWPDYENMNGNLFRVEYHLYEKDK